MALCYIVLFPFALDLFAHKIQEPEGAAQVVYPRTTPVRELVQ